MDFSSPFKKKSLLLNEAEDDENQNQNNDTNDTDEGFEAAPDDKGDDNAGNDDTSNEDNTDFNIDAEDDIQGDDSTGGDDTSSSSSSSSASGENMGAAGEANIDTAAKKKDREIFDSLSPEEQKLKTVKLKELYMKLYSRCDQIIEKYDTLGVEYEDLMEPIKHSLGALYSIKENISYWLLYLFDSKSYMENDIMFNRLLVAMNQIKMITKAMRDSHSKEIEDTKNNKPLNDKDIEREKNNS